LQIANNGVSVFHCALHIVGSGGWGRLCRPITGSLDAIAQLLGKALRWCRRNFGGRRTRRCRTRINSSALGAGIVNTLADILGHAIVWILRLGRKLHWFLLNARLLNALADCLSFTKVRRIGIGFALQFFGGWRRLWIMSLQASELTRLLNLSLNCRCLAKGGRRRLCTWRKGKFTGDIFGRRRGRGKGRFHGSLDRSRRRRGWNGDATRSFDPFTSGANARFDLRAHAHTGGGRLAGRRC